MRNLVAIALCLTLGAAATSQPKTTRPLATPADKLKVAKGFKAELIYAVPQERFGSWVNLCADPKGRLIVSDQYGAVYRITVPEVGTDLTKATLTIDPLPASIGEAQGMVWAFDALYVVVNSGKRKSGLYRVTSSQGNDTLDKVELLREIKGGGQEHGPHAVIPHPDGKRLTVVCGNQCQMIACNTSRVPRYWGEDHLLPRMPDGRGFMAGVLGPGGCIYNVTPDGKEWELFSTGFRNEFDAAYDKNGNLFTYDADMEWDFNTPWYRPTRICEVISGSEFGWRNGAGKYPPYYADSVPAILDVGPGSPTGICFGYGAKFPKQYQNALFICDWSYGKLYAVHLKPKGAVHSGELEEFVTGAPLPLTDVIINPVDGAMYFLIGGRKTQSALYRVTALSDNADLKPAIPASDADDSKPRELLATLANYHRADVTDEELVSIVGSMDHADRFVRFSARVALEHQPVVKWKATILEGDPAKHVNISINGLLALARVSAPCPHHRKSGDPPADPNLAAAILAKLNAIDFEKLSVEQRLDLIRVYEVLFNRFGKPAAEGRKATLEKYESAFPTGHRFVDGELGQVLVYLESPAAAEKLIKALQNAPTQEEQLQYAVTLRVLNSGWSPELRKQYFEWMQKADGFRGGHSFGGFLRQIKADAIKNLSGQDRIALGSLIETRIEPGTAKPAPRPKVKDYTMENLLPVVEKGLSNGRDYERGRKMFAAASCSACHRYDNEGGVNGPDLTQVAGRFSTKDLLESILDPNKEISDQYAATEFELDNGRKITGRVVNHNGDDVRVNINMLEPGQEVVIKRSSILESKLSKQSMMPADSLNTLKEDEILDLMAYLSARGDRNHAMFKK